METPKVIKSHELNLFDSVVFRGATKTFRLDERNDTDDDLILLYMYVLPLFMGHGIKVGMTKCKMGETFWHAIKSRIAVQEHELALSSDRYEKYGLLRQVVYWGVCLDARNESFKDYRVHDEILKRCAGLAEREQEWFCNVPMEDVVDAFRACRENNSKGEIYAPRKEQRDCVDALLNYFKKHPYGGRFLLNCKMRYGKSFTTYKYCEEADLNHLLILTFIPAVEASWEEDLSHIKKEYRYFKDKHLKKDGFDLKKVADPYVVFLSLQNYLGKDRNTSETKEKIRKLQEVDWDLVILDEYHFGAWNEHTQGTLEKQEDLDPEYQNELKRTKDVIRRFKIKTKQTICLSGTPFKALARGEFDKENTFTYSYFDEQRNKYPKAEEGDFSIVNPNYAHFPDMKIFGYNMSSLFSGMTASVFSGDELYGKKYFSLNRFFETRRDNNPNEPCVFIYEDEIKKWLEIIKGRSIHGGNFPYSNPDMLSNARHTLWLMPRVNAVHAMAKLLEKDEYFSRYEIIDLSKEGVGGGVDAFDYLNEGIGIADSRNKLGSIALTVNKLTIGVTVKQWFAVFVLKDLASPEQYFQSIFRIQTPFKREGQIYKKYGYVYDFNIDRAAALLLRYAEQSEEGNVTKLQVAKLIVRYLPIFINGDMSHPISESVFYNLASFGDTSGIPLSRRIIDTSRTTRMLDDQVMSEMLNDPQVSDVIKRVFAHAKFGKPKTKTMLPKPDDDGFRTEIATKGRDIGHQLGLEESEDFLGLGDDRYQTVFEEKLNGHLDTLCPEGLGEIERAWWKNGFSKGYEGGINAPIKKLNCGQNDGIAFAEKVKEKLGENIAWKAETRQAIKNICNIYLNDIKNIPPEYRGPLYKRWYCDSFIRAVKNKLTPPIDYEKGQSVEDADNVLKHILGRLFEFLYISVYRETTFNEIFNNADPDIFLEAVGITKNDFKILNKYHIFQEDVLNNCIHQFFVNESLGARLNLESETVKKHYRNSFDWFGFGLENDNVLFSESIRDDVEKILSKTNCTDNWARTEGREINGNSPGPTFFIPPFSQDDDINLRDRGALMTSGSSKPAPPARTYYLAYAEDLNRARVAKYAPSAKVVGFATLNGYGLAFKECGMSSRLTIEARDKSSIPCVVYEINESETLELRSSPELPLQFESIALEVDVKDLDGNIEREAAIVLSLSNCCSYGRPTDSYLASLEHDYKLFGLDYDSLRGIADRSEELASKAQSSNKIQPTLRERLKEILSKNPRGLKASRLARILGVGKREVNVTLYKNGDIFVSDFFKIWKLK